MIDEFLNKVSYYLYGHIFTMRLLVHTFMTDLMVMKID